MNEQNFGEHFHTSGLVEQVDQDTNSPEVNSDPKAEKVPVFAALVQQAPVGSGIVSTTDKPMNETIVQEAPGGETIVYKDSVGESVTHEAPILPNAVASMALLDHEESEHLHTRWNEIQGKFVDEPRSAVQQADALVSEVVEKITQMFASEHSSLEGQWKQGNDVSTEDLRKALQHYRSFFNRLVV